MRTHRFARLARACRLPVAFVLLHLICTPVLFAVDRVSGVVLDQSGRPVPRAYVRALTDTGLEVARGFADEAGRFELAVENGAACRLEVTLAGFKPATAPCASPGGEPLRLVLPIAPVSESVLVTATRTNAPANQVGASVTVFTAEDLERRQLPFLADLLKSTPGAMIVRNGGPGALTSLFVRGGESDYNKVLLDGVPLNEPGGSFYLNNLTTENLERVEIARGAYSSLFGSDAMSSVIQLFTKRGNRLDRPRVTAQLDGGTYGTWHSTVGVSGGSSRVDYSLGVARFSSDNRVPNSGLDNTTLSANVGLAISQTTTLRMIARGELEDVGTPGETAFGRPDLDAAFARNDTLGSISVDQRVSRSFQHRASYSLARSDQRSTNLQPDPPYLPTFRGRVAPFESFEFLNDSELRVRRHHVSYQADWRLQTGAFGGEHLTTVLADWDGERATQENKLQGTTTPNSRDNVGAAAQHQILWRRLFVTMGVRAERNGSFGTSAVPRATMVVVAHEGSGAFGETRVKASAGQGIKEPTMIESFSLSEFGLGNPDLQPERSRTIEAGVEQRLGSDRAKLEVTWFNNRSSNIISTRRDPVDSRTRYSNVGTTDACGFELGGQAAPLAALHLRANYTFLDSEIIESTAPGNVLFAKGQWAFRRPRHSGSVGGTMVWDRVTIDLSGVFIGRFVDSDFGIFEPMFTENPGHTTWDARVAVRLMPRVIGLLSIDNLTNKDYSEPIGFQPLLRVIRVGLRVAF